MEVINQIRRERGIGLDIAPDSDYGRAMAFYQRTTHTSSEELADRIYTKAAHFVLEFVQNADDNIYYPSVTSELTMDFDEDSGMLVVSTNEQGFKEEDVRSICDLGESTKKGSEDSIGEKGLGFKSVFKVASSVYICSKEFRFKLERANMLIPEWDETYAARPGYTVFHIPIADFNDRALVTEELRALQPTILLFLRKLRRLNITINGSSRAFAREDNGDFIHLLSGDQKSQSYLIERKEIATTPDPKLRPQAHTSAIVLAFPVGGERDLSPLLPAENQNVHAFLPLRKCGFSFIIQADFIATTNREDIQENLQWNVTLRDAIAGVFVGAIQKMLGPQSKRPNFRYTWLAYLATFNPPSFFIPIFTRILNLLSSRDIIEGTHFQLQRASRTLMIGRFEHQSHPFMEQRFLPNSLSYMTKKYNSVLFAQELKSLGVQTMTDDHLLHALEAMISKGEYKVQPKIWQDAAANFLIEGSVPWSDMRHLAIVPVVDGTWVALRQCSDLFFDSADGVHIPANVVRHIKRIPLTSARHRLFAQFGAKSAEPCHIAEEIYSLHAKNLVSAYPLLEHAKYLFTWRSSISTQPKGKLRVYDQAGRSRMSTSIYMDNPSSLNPVRLSFFLGEFAEFLHDDYLSAFAGSYYSEREWFLWLQEAGIAIQPRLSSRKTLSDELSSFVRLASSSRESSRDVLMMLQRYWSVFKSSPAVLKQLRGCQFMCRDSSLHPLQETFLDRSLLHGLNHISLPFLSVADPDSYSWNFLVDLGVSLRKDGAFWLKVLQRLQVNNVHITIPEVTKIYKELNRLSIDNEDLQFAFRASPLILVPGEHAALRWISVEDCTWRGPEFMRTKCSLKAIYPGLESFFTEVVNVCQQPDPRILITEMKRAIEEAPAQIELVTEIALEISDQIQEFAGAGSPSWVSDLVQLEMFPVRMPGESLLTLRHASDSFYIPDRLGHFSEVFSQKVPLLCQEWASSKFQPLFSAPPFKDRLKYLNDAISTAFDFGDTQCMPDTSATERYHGRMKYILAECLQRWGRFTFNHSKQHLVNMLQNLTVYRAQQIVARHSIDGQEAPPSTSQLVVLSGESDSSLRFIQDGAQAGFTVIVSAECSVEKEDELFSKELAPRLSLEFRALYGLMTQPLHILEEDLDIEALSHALDRASSDTWARSSPQDDNLAIIRPARKQSPRTSFPPNTHDADINQVSKLTVDRQRKAEKEAFEVLLQSVSLAGTKSDTAALLNGANTYDLPFVFGQMTLDKSSDVTSLVSREAPSSDLVVIPPRDASDYESAVDSPSSRQNIVPSGLSFIDSGVILRASSPPSQYEQENGIAGEVFALHMLKSLLPGFTNDCWKSEFRNFLNLDPCVPGVADFEYADKEGTLTTILFGKARFSQWSEAKSELPTYHIEVKTTSSGMHTPFHVKSAQLDKAASMRIRSASEVQPEIYVILRIADIRSTPSYRFLPDPHRLLYDGACTVVSDVQVVINV
ncbi:hypothetical protein BT96DRAFT_972297 [Gymnopus androsaceus JB14]|uniref:Sacsin/Nov domain-containing protein n=1 Tax=Gymnopus androsaceus JB14 TaxID=1447944 RepID=A0A6A4I975_9AGAR|nr:hypothetical protein BT96DRAFT_972297 [Gymnopus androsaceus JB14]